MDLYDRIYKEGKKVSVYELNMIIRKHDATDRVLNKMQDEVLRYEDLARKLFREGDDRQAAMSMIVAHELRKWYEKLLDC